jgi:hypothetical protein
VSLRCFISYNNLSSATSLGKPGIAIDASRGDRGVTDLDESGWKQIEESTSNAQADPKLHNG